MADNYRGLPGYNDPNKIAYVPISVYYDTNRANEIMNSTHPTYFPRPSTHGRELDIGENELVFSFRNHADIRGKRQLTSVLSSLNGFDGLTPSRSLEATYNKLKTFLSEADAERLISDVALSHINILGVSTAAVRYNDRDNKNVITIQTHGTARVFNKGRTIYQGQRLRAIVDTRSNFDNIGNLSGATTKSLFQKYILTVEGANPRSFASMMRTHWRAYRGNFREYTTMFNDSHWSETFGFTSAFEELARFAAFCGVRMVNFLAKKGIVAINTLTDGENFNRVHADAAIQGGGIDFCRVLSRSATGNNEFYDPATHSLDGKKAIACEDIEPIMHCLFGTIPKSGDRDNTHGRWVSDFIEQFPETKNYFRALREEFIDHVMFNSTGENVRQCEIGYESGDMSKYYGQRKDAGILQYVPQLSKLGGAALRYQQEAFNRTMMAFYQAQMLYDSTVIGTATQGAGENEPVLFMLRK